MNNIECCENDEINDIYNLKWYDIKNKQDLIIKIDFNMINEKDYKNIIRNFKKLKYKYMKKYKSLSNINIHIDGFNSKSPTHKDFMDAINAIMQENKKEMYNYIYDAVCDYLDNFFINRNACSFNNDRCGEKINTSCTVGCCRHFKNKKLGPILLNNELVVCEYLKDKRCSAKCISCKLFTCRYLKRKGINFKLKDIFLIDTFFNPIQKYFIKYKVFTPKEEIIKLLLMFSM